MVKFILYSTSTELHIQEIDHIQSILDYYNAELLVVNDTDKLIHLINGIEKTYTAVIFFVSSYEELENLVIVKEKFGQIPTILILPDNESKTLQRGMTLNPVFFMSKQDDKRHISLAVNELCYIYDEHFKQLNNTMCF